MFSLQLRDYRASSKNSIAHTEEWYKKKQHVSERRGEKIILIFVKKSPVIFFYNVDNENEDNETND